MTPEEVSVATGHHTSCPCERCTQLDPSRSQHAPTCPCGVCTRRRGQAFIILSPSEAGRLKAYAPPTVNTCPTSTSR